MTTPRPSAAVLCPRLFQNYGNTKIPTIRTTLHNAAVWVYNYALFMVDFGVSGGSELIETCSQSVAKCCAYEQREKITHFWWFCTQKKQHTRYIKNHMSSAVISRITPLFVCSMLSDDQPLAPWRRVYRSLPGYQGYVECFIPHQGLSAVCRSDGRIMTSSKFVGLTEVFQG